MDLNFIKVFDRWVAEFTATEDFNIHIEGVKLGNLSIFQKGTENGGYAFVNGAVPTPSAGTVYDCDFSATIYPKYMKVSCTTEPTLAVVTSGTEVVVNEVVPENLDFKFRVNMEETDSTVNGEVEGNFNGTYNTVAAFAKNYGTVEDYGYSVKDEDTLNKVDMKVNSYDVTEVEYHETDEYIKMQTDALSSNDADGAAVLRRDKVSFAYALPKEEPETPEVIEYEFWVPTEVDEFGGYYGEVYDDFSDIYNKIDDFIKKNGVLLEDGYYQLVDEEFVLSKTNITVNTYRVNGLELYSHGQIDLMTDGPHGMIGTTGSLFSDHIGFESPAPNPPKPSTGDVIEYHFEIPMEGMGYEQEGEIEGDFSNLYNKLATIAKEKGEFYESGQVYIIEGDQMSNINITVNEDTVTHIEYYENMEQLSLYTDGPEVWGNPAEAKLYKTSIYYFRGM